MRLLFTVRNDSLWVDHNDQIQRGICAALTATWIKATLDNGGPLSNKRQLTKADTLDALAGFYRRCTMAQARFRNEAAGTYELRRKLIMYGKIGLALPKKEDLSVSFMMNNKTFIKDTNGVYSLDVKGTDTWHALGPVHTNEVLRRRVRSTGMP
jgi:hypothetical protein